MLSESCTSTRRSVLAAARTQLAPLPMLLRPLAREGAADMRGLPGGVACSSSFLRLRSIMRCIPLLMPASLSMSSVRHIKSFPVVPCSQAQGLVLWGAHDLAILLLWASTPPAARHTCPARAGPTARPALMGRPRSPGDPPSLGVLWTLGGASWRTQGHAGDASPGLGQGNSGPGRPACCACWAALQSKQRIERLVYVCLRACHHMFEH